MQAYFKPEQTFSISMPQPVFEISIVYKKKKKKKRNNVRIMINTDVNAKN